MRSKMGPKNGSQDLSAAILTLKAVSYRLSSTPTEHLPALIPHLSRSLICCQPILSDIESSSGTDGSEKSVLVHKFKTQLSSFLQDRSVERRWAAVVLVKCAIELGGWESLRGCGAWIRGLLGILAKPDPSTTKHFCIVTLTRIFLLTREYPTLVRELTTPSLPAFITSCLSLCTSKSSHPDTLRSIGRESVLQTVLESFSQLIPRHRTIFRSFATRIRKLLLQLIAAASPSDDTHLSKEASLDYVSAECREIAQSLFVQLHFCASKSGSTEEWDNALRTVIAATHATIDLVLRSIEDKGKSAASIKAAAQQNVSSECHQPEPDQVGLPPWSGIQAGRERLVCLLGLLNQFLTTPTSESVNLRVGEIVNLLGRLLSQRLPTKEYMKRWHVQSKPSIQTVEEVEAVWASLPCIHVAAIEVMNSVSERMEHAIMPMAEEMLQQLVHTFRSEVMIDEIRAASYGLFNRLLDLLGPTSNKRGVSSLTAVIQSCCEDLIPAKPPSHQAQSSSAATHDKGKPKQSVMNADSFTTVASAAQTSKVSFRGVHAAAYELLPVLLAKLPAQHIPGTTRSMMDRTAILIQHKDAMLASVLNTPPNSMGKNRSSVLPLLARSAPSTLATEGLLRPRMPVIRTSGDVHSSLESEEAPAVSNEEPSWPKQGYWDDQGVLGNFNEKEEASVANTPAQAVTADGLETSLKPLFENSMTLPHQSAEPTIREKRAQEETAAEAPSPKRARLTEDEMTEPPSVAADSPLSETIEAPSAPAAPVIMHQPGDPTTSSVEGMIPAQNPPTEITSAGKAKDDDDDFEIPDIFLGSDSDDDEEEDEEGNGQHE